MRPVSSETFHRRWTKKSVPTQTLTWARAEATMLCTRRAQTGALDWWVQLDCTGIFGGLQIHRSYDEAKKRFRRGYIHVATAHLLQVTQILHSYDEKLAHKNTLSETIFFFGVLMPVFREPNLYPLVQVPQRAIQQHRMLIKELSTSYM